MAQDAVSQYRRWFEYEKDAHRQVLASFQTVPLDQRTSASFQKALNLMGHLVAARRMWAYRLGFNPDRPAQLFPEGVALEGLEGQFQDMERLWEDYYQRLGPEEVDRTIEYQTTEGERFRSRVEDILAQLHGHSLYHRGQIASLVKASGGQPATTDFIYWSREAVS